MSSFKRFFFHSTGKLHSRTLLYFCVSEKIWYRKVFSNRRGRIMALAKNFCNSTEKLHNQTNLFLFQENSGIEIVLSIGRGHRGFFWKFSYHKTKMENFIIEDFCFSKCFLYRKFSRLEGGITNFRQNFFDSLYREIWQAYRLCFRKYLVSKNFSDRRGRINALAKIFSHSTEKFIGEPFYFAETFWHREFFG